MDEKPKQEINNEEVIQIENIEEKDDVKFKDSLVVGIGLHAKRAFANRGKAFSKLRYSTGFDSASNKTKSLIIFFVALLVIIGSKSVYNNYRKVYKISSYQYCESTCERGATEELFHTIIYSSDLEVRIQYMMRNLKNDDEITIELIRLSDDAVLGSSVEVYADEFLEFSLTNHRTNYYRIYYSDIEDWELGRYKVVFTVDGKVVGVTRFNIKED